VDGVAPTTAEVRRAAEMSTTMAATVMAPTVMTTAVMATAMMTTAVMTTAVATTAMTTTFRGGIPGGRQHGRENNEGNLDIEF
jgi:type IV secretory pathway TrbL component